MPFNPMTTIAQMEKKANLERRNQREAAWDKFKTGVAGAALGIPFGLLETGGTELIKRKMAEEMPTPAEALKQTQGDVLESVSILTGLPEVPGLTRESKEARDLASVMGTALDAGVVPEKYPRGASSTRTGGALDASKKMLESSKEELSSINRQIEEATKAGDPSAHKLTPLANQRTALQKRIGGLPAIISKNEAAHQEAQLKDMAAEQQRHIKTEDARERALDKIRGQVLPDYVSGVTAPGGFGLRGLSEEALQAKRRTARAKGTLATPSTLIGRLNAASTAAKEDPSPRNLENLSVVLRAVEDWRNDNLGMGNVPASLSSAETRAVEVVMDVRGTTQAAKQIAAEGGPQMSPGLLRAINKNKSAQQLAGDPKFRSHFKGKSVAVGLGSLYAGNAALGQEFMEELLKIDAIATYVRRVKKEAAPGPWR
jgi:hypothetical protein